MGTVCLYSFFASYCSHLFQVSGFKTPLTMGKSQAHKAFLAKQASFLKEAGS